MNPQYFEQWLQQRQAAMLSLGTMQTGHIPMSGMNAPFGGIQPNNWGLFSGNVTPNMQAGVGAPTSAPELVDVSITPIGHWLKEAGLSPAYCTAVAELVDFDVGFLPSVTEQDLAFLFPAPVARSIYEKIQRRLRSLEEPSPASVASDETVVELDEESPYLERAQPSSAKRAKPTSSSALLMATPKAPPSAETEAAAVPTTKARPSAVPKEAAEAAAPGQPSNGSYSKVSPSTASSRSAPYPPLPPLLEASRRSSSSRGKGFGILGFGGQPPSRLPTIRLLGELPAQIKAEAKRPVYLVTFAGATGAGKTTLCRGTSALLQAPVAMSTDLFHVGSPAAWEQPSSVDFVTLKLNLERIAAILSRVSAVPEHIEIITKKGEAKRGWLKVQEKGRPLTDSPVFVCLDGFLVASDPAVASMMDYCLWLESSLEITTQRRILRARHTGASRAEKVAALSQYIANSAWPAYLRHKGTQLANLRGADVACLFLDAAFPAEELAAIGADWISHQAYGHELGEELDRRICWRTYRRARSPLGAPGSEGALPSSSSGVSRTATLDCERRTRLRRGLGRLAFA